ncbi:MAG: hypothetical protein RhofKO_10600 [Rhodothermales bacterium]
MNANLKRANVLHKTELRRWLAAWEAFCRKAVELLPDAALEYLAAANDTTHEVLDMALCKRLEAIGIPEGWDELRAWLDAEAHVLDNAFHQCEEEEPDLSLWPDRFHGVDVPEVSAEVWSCVEQLTSGTDALVAVAASWQLLELGYIRVARQYVKGADLRN